VMLDQNDPPGGSTGGEPTADPAQIGGSAEPEHPATASVVAHRRPRE
jgi:hypothetical protein